MKITDLIKEVVVQYSRRGGSLVSAAFAFYVLLFMAPMLIVAMAFAELIFSKQTTRIWLTEQLLRFFNAQQVSFVTDFLNSTASQKGFFATAISIAISAIAASKLFSASQRGFNQVWKLRTLHDQGMPVAAALMIRKRLFSFMLVLFAGITFPAVLGAKAILEALRSRVAPFLGDGVQFQLAEFLLIVGVVTVVVAVIFRWLPDARVDIRDLWFGAVVTAALCALGALVAGLYVRHLVFFSNYGAVGSVIVFLLWVYYCSQSLFLGATFTHVWADRCGRGISPRRHATHESLP